VLLALLPLLAVTSACVREPEPLLRIERVLTPTSEPLAQAAPTGTAAAPPVSAPLAITPAPSVTPTTPGSTPSATATSNRSEGRYTPPAYVTPAPSLRPGSGREDAELVRVIEEALGDDKDGASVVVKRLTDGATAHWNADRVHYAASLYKLTVLYEAFRQRKLGALSFEKAVPVTGAYLDQDLGTINRLPRTPEGDLEIGVAVRGMVALSDNTSATILLDLLGHRNIDATMRALGLTSTSVNTTELPTSALDMARVMEAIVRGEGLDPQAAQEMLAMLLAQETRSGIPRGIPAGVRTGNKTGTWPGATHDVAVVLAPTGAYVIAVLTDGSWAWDPITRVSRAVYEYWNIGRQAGTGR
jgi:beta-lactamase class A